MDQEKKEEKIEEINQFDQQPSEASDASQVSETSETFESDNIPELTESSETSGSVIEDIGGFTEDVKPTEIQELSEMKEPIEVPELIEDVKPYEAPKSDSYSQPVEVKTTDTQDSTVDSTVPEPKVINDEVAPVTTIEDVKPAKKRYSFQLVLAIFVVWSVITAGGAYLLRDASATDVETQKDSEINSLKSKLVTVTAEVASLKAASSSDKTTVVEPTAAAIANIKAAITSGNTAALEGYMASSVSEVTEATSGSTKNTTPTAAVATITSFIAGTTWDFAVPTATLNAYGAGSYAKYFPSTAVVGESASKRVISFTFDNTGKINTVFYATTESQLR